MQKNEIQKINILPRENGIKLVWVAKPSPKSYLKVIYKKEFYRLKEIVQADNVKVYAYKKKSHFCALDAGGYANVFDRKIGVMIAGTSHIDGYCILYI